MNRTTIAGAVLFTALAVALVIGTTITGVDDHTTPLITTVLGFIGLSVSQILGNKSTEETKETTEQLNADLRNGTFERLVREAIVKIAKDETTSLEIKTDETSQESEREGTL